MTQPIPVVDPAEVHAQAMRVPVLEATKLWALIQLDEVEFQKLNAHRASLRVRGFKTKIGVTWQFDGQEYPLDTVDRKGPLRPGERLWVPLIVAQFGVRNTAAWEYETDISGNVIDKQDFLYGQQIPLVKILEVRNPGDFGTQQAQAVLRLAKCAFCAGEFAPEELAAHMVGDHAAELVAATKPQPAKGKVKADLDAWAAQQAAKGKEAPPAAGE